MSCGETKKIWIAICTVKIERLLDILGLEFRALCRFFRIQFSLETCKRNESF